MKFDDMRDKFKTELSLVDDVIINNLKSNVSLIDDIGKYIVCYGGKRVRPLMTILFSKIFDYSNDNIILMSGVMELIHTATLLHDDVVDLSEKRRNKLSVNKVWGNKEAILVGDFLYTRSFQMMVSTDNINILKLMAGTTNIMSEGEVNQLFHKRNFDIKESDYFDIIKAKTAQLFSASASVVPMLFNLDSDMFKAASDYGMHLGIAYQLIDDMLDYSSDDDIFGKNVGDDIFSGTFTLPLIYLMLNDKSKKNLIIDMITDGYSKKDLFKIREYIFDSGSLDYTFLLAKKHADLAKKAISSIKSTEYTQMALSLIDFIINRKY